MRGPAAVVAGAAVLAMSIVPAAAAPAAGPLGERGTWVVSADRLMPLLAYSKASETGNNFSTSSSVTSLSFLSYGVPQDIAYTIPRLSLDYTIAPNLTIGGSVMAFFQLSNSSTTTLGNTSSTTDNPKISGWAIAPRAGYVLSLGQKVVAWPRAGLSYYSESVSNPPNMGGQTTTDGFHQLAIDLEANFVVLAAPHFFVIGGPVIDIPVTGSASSTQGNTTTSIDSSQFHFGIAVGLGGYL